MGTKPAYALDASHPKAPRYWRDEQTGVLASAVDAYLAGEMSGEQIAAMRAYIQQWINSPTWDLNPAQDGEGKARLAHLRFKAGYLSSFRAIRDWLIAAEDYGVDPL